MTTTAPPTGLTKGKVCVLYTGGTIGTRTSKPEIFPVADTMLTPEELAAVLPKPSEIGVDFTVEPIDSTFEPIVSSKISPDDWRKIAKAVEIRYAHYDGFVILHGTDTLAYTASALSFMFVNLTKPIVLTGSQRPISDVPTDAQANFVNSIVLAARARDTIPVIPEVIICFGDRVLRGNRAQKLSSVSWQGFDTPNAPALGRVGRTFDIQSSRLRPAPAPHSKCFVRGELGDVVDVIMYPGMTGEQLSRTVGRAKGVILRTFGAGNPPGDASMLTAIGQLVNEGAVVVNVTQCNEGTVEAGMLTGVRDLSDLGVVSGLDMTAEAAFTKLMVLLGNQPPGVAAEQMQVDQRGEQSTNLVEFRSTSIAPPDGDIHRVVLSPSLPVHCQLNRLSSAILRIRSVMPSTVSSKGPYIEAYLNNWTAGHSTGKDDRRVLNGFPDTKNRAIAADVTEAARSFLEVGAPLTLTVVPDEPLREFEIVLSLFTDQADISSV